MKQGVIFRLALLFVIALAALAFMINVPQSASAASDGQSFYQNLGQISATYATNSKASVSRYASYDAQTCVEITNVTLATGFSTYTGWDFSLRGKNNSRLWQSLTYGGDESKCSPWVQQHNGVYTVVDADPGTTLDAKVWIYTN